MGALRSVSEFDQLLVEAIDETIKYCLGERNTTIIEDYLEKQSLPLSKVSVCPEQFSEELRNIMGLGGGRILGAAVILEESILDCFFKKLGIVVKLERPVNFPKQITSLRAQYSPK